MDVKKTIKKYILVTIFIIMMAVSQTLSLKADIGVCACWDSISLNVYQLTGFKVGTFSIVGNLICVLVMGGKHHHHHGCHHEHEHKEENLNFKAAYLHILADAFTSILAIAALLLGKYFGLVFLDPCIGILGGLIIAKWAVDLIKSSSLILLDFKTA